MQSMLVMSSEEKGVGMVDMTTKEGLGEKVTLEKRSDRSRDTRQAATGVVGE